MRVPVPVAVNVTEQVDAVAFKTAKVQGDPTNEPAALPVLVKATVPSGDVAPVEAVSWTTAEHETGWLMTAELGVHVTVVVVACATLPLLTTTF